MLVLRALLGTPLGLNLRNIAWHGFFALEEFWPAYLSFTLVLCASLHKICAPVLETFPVRPLYNISEHFDEHWIKRGPPLLTEVQRGTGEDLVIESLIRRSAFPIDRNRFLLHSAVGAFMRGDYHLCLSLALPFLEHSLRHVFVRVNNLPRPMLTAGMFTRSE
jgi:hypothetical protein